MLILIAAIQTRQIQNNDIADLICADGSKHFLIFRAICIAAGVAAVAKDLQIMKSLFLCVMDESFLLILRTGRRHGATAAMVDTAIKRGDFIRLPNHIILRSGSHHFLLSDTNIISNVRFFVKFHHILKQYFLLPA